MGRAGLSEKTIMDPVWAEKPKSPSGAPALGGASAPEGPRRRERQKTPAGRRRIHFEAKSQKGRSPEGPRHSPFIGPRRQTIDWPEVFYLFADHGLTDPRTTSIPCDETLEHHIFH